MFHNFSLNLAGNKCHLQTSAKSCGPNILLCSSDYKVYTVPCNKIHLTQANNQQPAPQPYHEDVAADFSAAAGAAAITSLPVDRPRREEKQTKKLQKDISQKPRNFVK